MPFLAVTKNGTFVPSLDVANNCFVSNWFVSIGSVGASNGVLIFDTGSYANTVVGNNGELKEKKISGVSSLPPIPATVPVPGNSISGWGVPSVLNTERRLRTSARYCAMT